MQRQDCDEAARPQRCRNDNEDEDEDDIDTIAAEDFGHPCRLSAESFQRVRDFLHERSKSCQDNSRPCLPFLPAMNAFLQLYFEHFSPQMPFIHAPTFEPDNATELLLVAIANIGCQYSRSRHRHAYRNLFMQVLGSTIQQQVGLVLVLILILTNNSLVLNQLPHALSNTNLDLLQCVLLYHVCLMCGGLTSEMVKLQLERSTLVTLFRHSKRPMNGTQQRFMVSDIQGFWRSWIHAETEKRVLYSVWGK